MVSGEAVMLAVGAGADAAGGGGGGAAAAFLWHPATVSMAAAPATRTTKRRL